MNPREGNFYNNFKDHLPRLSIPQIRALGLTLLALLCLLGCNRYSVEQVAQATAIASSPYSTTNGNTYAVNVPPEIVTILSGSTIDVQMEYPNKSKYRCTSGIVEQKGKRIKTALDVHCWPFGKRDDIVYKIIISGNHKLFEVTKKSLEFSTPGSPNTPAFVDIALLTVEVGDDFPKVRVLELANEKVKLDDELICASNIQTTNNPSPIVTWIGKGIAGSGPTKLQYFGNNKYGLNVHPIYSYGDGSAITPPGASGGPCTNLLGKLKALIVASYYKFNSLLPNISYIVDIHPSPNEGRSLKELIALQP